MRKAHMFDVGQFAVGEWRNGREWDTFVHYLKSDRALERVPFMAPDLPEGFVQRPREFDWLLHALLNPPPDHSTTEIASVHGAGGYGKTTLATAICHDERIIDAFDDGVLWTSLGQSPDLTDSVANVPGFDRPGHGPPLAYVVSAGREARASSLPDCRRRRDRAHLNRSCAVARIVRLITTRRADLSGSARRIHVDEMNITEATRVLEAAVAPPWSRAGLWRHWRGALANGRCWATGPMLRRRPDRASPSKARWRM
jgi:hypothetical protein